MKVIVIEPKWQNNNTSEKSLFNSIKETPVYTLADTTLLTHNKPMFVPDYGGKCYASCCLAVRISRLGKSIPERFAFRYLDAISVGVRFELSELRKELSDNGIPWDIAASFDGAATLGGFLELEGNEEKDVCVKLEVDGKNICSQSLENTKSLITQALAFVSKFYMIRQGDIMLIPMPTSSIIAESDTHYVGSINEIVVLEFNVK